MANTIIASSQQTRFHIANSTTTTSSSSSKELDVPGVCISIANTGKGPEREILSDTHLKLSAGVHYALIGRNGVGKSTLLRAIGEKLIPGIPTGLRIVLLQQTYLIPEEESEKESSSVGGTSESEVSVLEFVISSDRERTEALKRQKLLQQALDNIHDPTAAVMTMRNLKLKDDLRELEEARKTANLRSGSRGLAARKELKVIEKRVAKKQEGLEIVDSQTLAEETSEVITMLADIDALLEEMSSSTAESRAKLILRGLGFKSKPTSSPSMSQSISSLSGGWRMRAHLAAVLFQPCDLLLLDEPTNFLDLPSLLWLETHLQQDLPPNTTVLFVSHDRTFTDAVAEEILVLRDLTLERFPGNLSSYEATRSERQRYLRAHMQDTVAGNIRAAKATGDDKKLRQAASRQKKLDERMGYEVGMRGGRFKLNRDLPGYHISMREGIDAIIPKDDPGIKVVLPSPGELRFPGPLISVEGLRFAYRAGANVKGVGGKEVLTGVNLVVHPATRVGIVGLNGTGKSTLVRCLVDQSMEGGRITTGSVTRHPTARVGFFSQDAIEQLPLTKTALQVMVEGTGATDATVDSHDARAALASGRTGREQRLEYTHQQALRWAKGPFGLAMMLYPPPKLGPVPHVLVLDEVTTHLDADTVIVLAEELEKFEGALIVVSHDRWFVRQVVEGDDGAGTVFEVEGGKLVELKGGIADFEKKIKLSKR
ncbi:P-loop containing nucleoside triphosphate hydrolase protein [Gymnopus androsaceus JB14]|uniref:P-loop containing nucleoside triphosphate hydrolase protein n=1 Tax=Gymnopus androsaceus JB14 TaxID=1447944 RepID=A0A6A4HSE3_9AGAR|nr:P-loop containing nucleoside triphosphate hydrolase protein [Gymnopus androsaceus JB14]